MNSTFLMHIVYIYNICKATNLEETLQNVKRSYKYRLVKSRMNIKFNEY